MTDYLVEGTDDDEARERFYREIIRCHQPCRISDDGDYIYTFEEGKIIFAREVCGKARVTILPATEKGAFSCTADDIKRNETSLVGIVASSGFKLEAVQHQHGI